MQWLFDFTAQGGPVLYGILLVCLLLWSLILERLYYFYIELPKFAREVTENWQQRSDQQSWTAQQIRHSWLSQHKQSAEKNLSTISILIAICPLMGLLGTVTGMISVFDWQPSSLRLMLRVDGLPQLTIEQRQAALQCAMDFLAKKFHTRNFAYQWVEGQQPEIQTMLTNMGYELRATLRDAWRVGEEGFANVLQYHFLNHQEKPKAGRMGEFDNPAQNLNKDVERSTNDKETK